ncbi:MAG: hypothetical protein DRO05_04935 [Thermoproteota archaeon]|nr:MAG: hypothetical protein DRO05_04935 [Candidatus Korarchaeota archaeon]
MKRIIGMKIRWNNGIEVSNGSRVLMDAKRTVEDVPILITHAHSDHVPRDVRRSKSKLIATSITGRALKSVYRAPKELVVALDFGKEIEVGQMRITPFVAGHVPGSAMFLLEKGGRRVLYTGDVNPRGGLAVEGPADVPEADVLIIETTYGSPKFRFPNQNFVRAKIVEWALSVVSEGSIPIFSVYPLGKAQEIIALLNKTTKLKVLVTDEVARMSDICQPTFRLSYERIQALHPMVAVVKGPSSNVLVERGKTAIATGWALILRPRRVHRAFPLSSHADFDGLLEIVRRSKAKEVYTVFGFSNDFTSYLRMKLGIKAAPLTREWVTV